MSDDRDDWPWSELQPADPPPYDDRAARRAYARRLKSRDWSSDPEGFAALRDAYDFALKISGGDRPRRAVGGGRKPIRISRAPKPGGAPVIVADGPRREGKARAEDNDAEQDAAGPDHAEPEAEDGSRDGDAAAANEALTDGRGTRGAHETQAPDANADPSGPQVDASGALSDAAPPDLASAEQQVSEATETPGADDDDDDAINGFEEPDVHDRISADLRGHRFSTQAWAGYLDDPALLDPDRRLAVEWQIVDYLARPKPWQPPGAWFDLLDQRFAWTEDGVGFLRRFRYHAMVYELILDNTSRPHKPMTPPAKPSEGLLRPSRVVLAAVLLLVLPMVMMTAASGPGSDLALIGHQILWTAFACLYTMGMIYIFRVVFLLTLGLLAYLPAIERRRPRWTRWWRKPVRGFTKYGLINRIACGLVVLASAARIIRVLAM